MTVNEYAKATDTPMFTVRTWIRAGLPYTPATQIHLDVNQVEAWKIEKGKSRGIPKGKAAA